MSQGRIFLVGATQSDLTPMDETPYDSEDLLQWLLATHPDLLPGDQIDPADPRRWLLVGREVGVPGRAGGSDVWSLDHLFIDQSGTPTFIECKRSSDTRARREVVAQMLDYAANGIAYWTMDRLRQVATEAAEATNKGLDEAVRQLLDEPDADVEAFWQRVEDNLRKGRVRLVFVADHTTPELRRLVEFLNEKMSDVEVLVVEVKQFLGQDHRVVVPRVIGLTQAALNAKATASGTRPVMNREALLAVSEPTVAGIFAHMLDEAERRGHPVAWNASGFTVGLFDTRTSRRITYGYANAAGRFELYLEYLHRYGLLDAQGEAALRARLLALGNLVEAGKYTLKALLTEHNSEAMKRVFDRIAEEMQQLLDAQSG